MEFSSRVAIFYMYMHFIFYFVFVVGTTYFCDNNQETVINDASGTIRTVRQGINYYDNDLLCVWVLSANSEFARLQLTVEFTDLQWAPEKAICNGYDYVEIRDGKYL